MVRRRFLKILSLSIPSLIGVAGIGSLIGNVRRPRRAPVFRPPGAQAKWHFIAHCIRCGQCGSACPYDAIRISDTNDPAEYGTPYLVLRETPCYMCPDLPCVRACPTNALDPKLTDPEKVYIGTAAIVDREACLSLNGLRCEVCYRVCPRIDKAITVLPRHNARTGAHTIFEPVVHKDLCTGCGICEYSCVLDEPAIAVVAGQRGDKSGHYIAPKQRCEGDGKTKDFTIKTSGE